MDKTLVNTESLRAMANALRDLTGSEDKITPSEMSLKLNNYSGDINTYSVRSIEEMDDILEGKTIVGKEVYKKGTVEEMKVIDGAEEGAYCVVINSTLTPYENGAKVSKMTLPLIVTLGSTHQNGMMMLSSEDRNAYIDIYLSSKEMSFSYNDWNKGIYINKYYKSSDGITFNLYDDYSTQAIKDFVIEFNSPVYSSWEYNADAAKFMLCESVEFSGLYRYENGEWNFANININTKTNNVYPGEKYYSNKGLQIGTMGVMESVDDLKKFNELVAGMSISGMTSLYGAFENTTATSIPVIPVMDTSDVTDFGYCFRNASKVTNIDISMWDTSKAFKNDHGLSGVSGMFENCTSLKELKGYGQLVDEEVKVPSGMFAYCSSLEELPELSEWRIGPGTNLNMLFTGCSSLKVLDTSSWGGYSPESTSAGSFGLSQFLNGCSSLVSVDFSGLQGYFSTGDGNFMKDCSSIERVDMSGMLIGGGTYSSLARAFMDCTSLRQLILCGGDPYNITSMCNGCTSLEYLDMRNLNVAGANIYSNAFDGVPANCEIIVKDTSNLNWVKAQRSDFTNVHIA